MFYVYKGTNIMFLCYYACVKDHRKENVVILTSIAANDEDFVKMTTFPF